VEWEISLSHAHMILPLLFGHVLVSYPSKPYLIKESIRKFTQVGTYFWFTRKETPKITVLNRFKGKLMALDVSSKGDLIATTSYDRTGTRLLQL